MASWHGLAVSHEALLSAIKTRPTVKSATRSSWRQIETTPYVHAVGDVFERPTVKYRRPAIAGAESIYYGLEAPPALCAILAP